MNPVTNLATGTIDNNFNTWYEFIQPTLGPFPSTVATLPFNNPYIPTLAVNATITKDFPNWLADVNNEMDVRGFYLTNCGNVSYSLNGYCQLYTWPTNYLTHNSSLTGRMVSFTTESIFYAQSSYFVSIVMIQWSNVFACKSRKVHMLLFRSPSSIPASISTWSEVSSWKPSSSSSYSMFRESTKCSEAGIFLY